jgi:hypothetical protein
VLCVWQSDNDSTLQARRIIVSATLTISLGAANTIATGTAAPPIRPRLAKSDRGTRRHALVYQRVFNNGAFTRPYLLILDDTGAPIAVEFAVNTADLFDQGFTEVDGDGTTWTVAWEASLNSQPDSDILAKTFTYDAANRRVVLNISGEYIQRRIGEHERLPSVICTGDSCLVCWSEQFPRIPELWTAMVRSVDPFDCVACEGTFSLSSPNATNLSPFGCSVASGGGQGDDALLVWESTSATTGNSDIAAQLWRSVDGAVTSLGGGCGVGGVNQATCARSPNPSFEHRLIGATAFTQAVFILSGQRLES